MLTGTQEVPPVFAVLGGIGNGECEKFQVTLGYYGTT